MKTHLQALKAHIKSEALKLKDLKQQRKVRENGYVEELWGTRLSYRAHHIVASLMRGCTIEQIENHRIRNPPDPRSWTESHLLRIITSVQDKYKEMPDVVE